MSYQDITNIYKRKRKYKLIKQKYFIDDKGTKYIVDGKHVVLKLTKREVEVAKILGASIGGKVKIMPRISQPPGIKTPDYIIKNEKFDLKEITGSGKYVIEGNLRKKKKQANNFIIDLTNTKIDLLEVKRQIKSIYISKRFLWIDKIVTIKNSELIVAFKRK